MTWTPTLDSAIEYIQTTVRTITTIRSAPSSPRDQEATFPLSVCFPKSGYFEGGGVYPATAHHTVVLQIHYPRLDLSRAYDTMIPYIETIAEKLLEAPTLGGNVTTIEGLRYTFGTMSYGETPTLGWQFEIDLKIVHSESA